MLRYMLDTDICTYTIKSRPPELRALFNDRADSLCVSSVTLTEPYFGAEKSTRPDHNLSVVEGFAARLETIPFDSRAAAHYGQIRATLQRHGTPIGPYDLMIAAHARAEGLALVSNNVREFARVDGLRIDNWLDDGRHPGRT
ncbi:MAG: tRNA(fMet)-specific endonuclease VapC [Ectothiorhodospiraceae bacterium]|nr:tRNA(fMet)-specific endonuclease VapC [Ectothiorhodospiraceae bacterium]